MNTIIDNNEEIVNHIREIYHIASSDNIRQLIEKHFIPTVQEKNAEIPTPVKLVDEMLETIPGEFWTTPKKVFEPCCGKGNFVLGIFNKFYNGLSELIPDKVERCQMIVNKCLYYADLTTLNVFITTEILKCHIEHYSVLSVFDFNSNIGDSLSLNVRDKWHIKNFDAVIGNPPYSTDPTKSNNKPLYHKFVEKYITEKMLLFVIPSRWFMGGKNLDQFRAFMLQRKDIVFIRHEDHAKKWFGNCIQLAGGVNYFLKDSKHKGKCLFNDTKYDLSKYDCVVNPIYHKIVDTVKEMKNIGELYMGRCFNIETNDKRLKDEGKIKCFVSLQQSKTRIKYLDNYKFTEENTCWKVVTARANNGTKKFGAMFVAKPTEVHTGSYISFKVNSEKEADSLLSYLQTKFSNHMLSIRKVSQDISANTCAWIPLVPLDRVWNEYKVLKYLNVDDY